MSSVAGKKKWAQVHTDEVLGCGHPFCCSLSKCIDISLIPFAPQIHSHMLTSKSEAEDMGYQQVEYCCHGCGRSVIVMFRGSENAKCHKIRDKFIEEHKACPDYDFKSWCPDVRLATEVIDLRSPVSKDVAAQN